MFQVLWERGALDELAGIWLSANSAGRQAITAATNQLDQALRRDPSNFGESRDSGERVGFVFPLGVRFGVSDADMTVRVLRVWRTGH